MAYCPRHNREFNILRTGCPACEREERQAERQAERERREAERQARQASK